MISNLLPDITITTVNLPAGEDVNSLLQSHEVPAVLPDLIEQRQPFSFSIERKDDTPLSEVLIL